MKAKSFFQNIYCVGRNYAEHAKELGNEVPHSPIIFLKPNSSVTTGPSVTLPHHLGRIDHEVELVLKIKMIADRPRVCAMAIGVDITARDIQNQAKAAGQPWTLAKGQKQFAPVGRFYTLTRSRLIDWDNLELRLEINGQVRQKGSTREMIFKVPTLLKYLHDTFELKSNDLIFTGTPAGVGPLKLKDRVVAQLCSGNRVLSVLKFRVK